MAFYKKRHHSGLLNAATSAIMKTIAPSCKRAYHWISTLAAPAWKQMSRTQKIFLLSVFNLCIIGYAVYILASALLLPAGAARNYDLRKPININHLPYHQDSAIISPSRKYKDSSHHLSH